MDDKQTYRFDKDEIRDLLETYRQPCLIIRNRKDFGTVIPLVDEETIIGRDEDGVITVGDRTDGVSRRHAKIVAGKDEVEIFDLDSNNGVFVNSKKVKHVNLNGSETILLGKVILQFQYLNQNEIESYRSYSIDPLTGSYNRQYFVHHIEDIFNKCIEEKRQLSIVMIDVDNLKYINDTYGHIAGDYALATFGTIVRNSFDKYDRFYRYGGDEFIMVLEDYDKEKALKFAMMLKSKVDSYSFTQDGIKLPFSMSVGVASKDELPDDSRTTVEMMRIADIRLSNQEDS